MARTQEWPHAEWQIAFLFYATLQALHVAAWGGKPPDGLTHADRDTKVSTKYPSVSRHYFALHALANQARYTPAVHSMERHLDNARELAKTCLKAFGLTY